MFCGQTFEVLTAVKANCRAKGKLFTRFIFLNFQAHFFAQKQNACLQKLFLTSKNSYKEYFVERKQSSRQQPPTPNLECLAPKHVMFAPN